MKSARSDLRLRRELPAPERELLDTYEAATQRTVHLDYLRVSSLSQLILRDVTPHDILVVIRYVKRRIRLGDNRHRVGTFVPASLEFINLLGDTSRFLDRLQTAKEEFASKRKARDGAVTVQCGLDTITRIGPVDRAPKELRENVVAGLTALIRELQK